MFTGLGIDISDHHIRIAEVSFFGVVKRMHERELPKGVVIDEKIQKPDALRLELEKLLETIPSSGRGKQKVTLLIPESNVFSSSFILPRSVGREALEKESLVQGQKDIPMSAEQGYVTISQGEKVEGGIRTTLYLSPKEVIDSLKEVARHEGLELVAMEANTKALFRTVKKHLPSSLRPVNVDQRVVVVDVGNSWTTISMYTPTGANIFSRTMKHKNETSLEEREVLSGEAIEAITSGLKESMLYFQKQGASISMVVLAGVEAKSPGLQKALEQFTKETSVQLIGDAINIKGVTAEELHTYGGAIGAAMRSVQPFRYRKQHNFN